MPLREGDTVGPYRILGPVGQGGMASVFRGYHAKLDRHVALKMLHKGLMEDEGFLNRFEREAQIVAKLEHPHIVPVYDFAEHEGQPYLVMKYVEGKTLKRLMADSPLPLERIQAIMTTIADALTYAHNHGVLHRDIKPSNIIIADDGGVYLTDFGLARIVQAGPSTMSADMILGTPQYISPEQAAGQAELTPATDIYSLGVILYEMVVGRVPFNADTPYAVVHDHIYTPLPLPSEVNPQVPPPVEAVLVRALAKQPTDRYESATAMIADFRAACASAGLTTLPEDRQAVAEASLVARKAASIPSPLPPSLPEASASAAPIRPRRTSKVELSVDLDGDGIRRVGEQIKAGVERGANIVQRIGEAIEDATRDEDEEPSRRSRSRRTPEEELERKVRQRIKKAEEERVGLLVHGAAFVTMNIIFWSLYFTSGADFPWPIWVTGGWGIGMAAHAIGYWNEFGPGAAKREARVQDEIAREKARSLLLEKPKNEEQARYRLTDDGELEAVEVWDEATQSYKRKRG